MFPDGALRLERGRAGRQPRVPHGRLFRDRPGGIPRDVDPATAAERDLSAANGACGDRGSGFAVHPDRVGEGRRTRRPPQIKEIAAAGVALEIDQMQHPARVHDRLAAAIIDGGGAVVSEHAPGTRPTRGTFPRRNRIISGLADAVIVVEAGAVSGALLTAAWALEQGRECFLVPGAIDAPQSAGCLAWLRDYGGVARIVAGIPQLLEDLGLAAAAAFPEPTRRSRLAPPSRPLRRPSIAVPVAELSPRDDQVARGLVMGAATADELVALTRLPIGAVLAGLTALEAAGFEVTAVIASQEEERKRFAADLHDGLGQIISAVRLSLSKENPQQSTVDHALALLNDMNVEIRNIAFNLMPQALMKDGLEQALQEFATRMNRTGKVHVSVQSFKVDTQLGTEQKIALYRVCQEWVNNVVKYGKGQNISIQLVQHIEELMLTIEDDGKGFDTNLLVLGQGNGWRNINSRIGLIKGTIEIDSEPGRQGTTVMISIPLLTLAERP